MLSLVPLFLFCCRDGPKTGNFHYRDGVTQEELSQRAGIPRRHLSEMENGKRPIGKESAKKLAAALHCDYRRFL